MADDTWGRRTGSKAGECWGRALGAEERADKTQDLEAKRIWREVASEWREMAVYAERHVR
jgi:hypothetical protein